MTRADQIFAAFVEFHRKHPEIYDLFKRYAAQAIQSGRQHFSSDCIIQRIRWETSIATKSADDEVKINNNFGAYYARLFTARNPKHQGFFRNRVRISTKQAPRMNDRQTFIDPSPGPEDDDLNDRLKDL